MSAREFVWIVSGVHENVQDALAAEVAAIAVWASIGMEV